MKIEPEYLPRSINGLCKLSHGYYKELDSLLLPRASSALVQLFLKEYELAAGGYSKHFLNALATHNKNVLCEGLIEVANSKDKAKAALALEKAVALQCPLDTVKARQNRQLLEAPRKQPQIRELPEASKKQPLRKLIDKLSDVFWK